MIRQLWRALLCVFVVFVGVGRMADSTCLCRVFVESLKTSFTGGGPFPAKCTCTQEHFGAPPFWLIIFINGRLSHHNSKIAYAHAKCTNHANGRSDSRLSGRTTNLNFRWCKRTRNRVRLAERSGIPPPKNPDFNLGNRGKC